MKTTTLALFALAVTLVSCVSGPPILTPDQEDRLMKISVHKAGENPVREYTVLEEISGADCSGAPAGGRIWGNTEKAIETLKKKAVAMNADAVINVSCGAVPFLNNCWAAQKCSGQAVIFK
jgi:hypothetical protein